VCVPDVIGALAVWDFTTLRRRKILGTNTQNKLMVNQHTRGMATARHRSLVERGERKALLESLHKHQKKNKKKCQEKPIFTNLKK